MQGLQQDGNRFQSVGHAQEKGPRVVRILILCTFGCQISPLMTQRSLYFQFIMASFAWEREQHYLWAFTSTDSAVPIFSIFPCLESEVFFWRNGNNYNTSEQSSHQLAASSSSSMTTPAALMTPPPFPDPELLPARRLMGTVLLANADAGDDPTSTSPAAAAAVTDAHILCIESSSSRPGEQPQDEEPPRYFWLQRKIRTTRHDGAVRVGFVLQKQQGNDDDEHACWTVAGVEDDDDDEQQRSLGRETRSERRPTVPFLRNGCRWWRFASSPRRACCCRIKNN